MTLKLITLTAVFVWYAIIGGCGSSGTEEQTYRREPISAILTNPAIVLEGAIVTPETVIPHGWVVVRNGLIDSVSEQKPIITNAIEIQTQGIIYPGLIDLHNHVSWNVFPCWDPGKLFLNRNKWRHTTAAKESFETASESLTNHCYNYPINCATFCDMNTYGEIRALIGGTTSILSTWDETCISGLVRNLDYASGFYGNGEFDTDHICSKIDIPTKEKDINYLRQHLSSSTFEAFVIHLAEGTDEESRKEFDSLDHLGLLTSKTVIVHALALGESEFKRMKDVGASLVWSPHSNEQLYGQTLNICLAIEHNIPLALAPDWAITGSSNMLAELRYAAKWCSLYMNTPLSDQTLVEMATSIPAFIAGIDDEVGTIQPGLRADLLVIAGNPEKPYRSLLEAGEKDLELVLINGVPIYGEPTMMSRFWNMTELSNIPIGGKNKSIKMAKEGDSFEALVGRLQEALDEQGKILAALTENCITVFQKAEKCTTNLFKLGPVRMIKFYIPSHDEVEMSNVKLVIYNTRGQEVTTLINEQLITGSHEVEWNTSNLPGGIYFYKIEAGAFVETKKMILVK